MIPVSITEQLMFSTVRLCADNGSCGTGYFYNFVVDDNIIPVIITNKHVINYNPDETVTFTLHLTKDGQGAEGNYAVRLLTHWVFHPEKDLCFAYSAPIEREIYRITGKNVFRKAIGSDLVWPKEKLLDLSMSESVVMVGYPNGLFDQIHNFPVFRYGKTAAHPGYDFNNIGIGLIDIACFPGSSGSPVFIVDEGSFLDKNGGVHLGENRVVFLGTLYAGATINVDGSIKEITIPTGKQYFSQTQMMMSLGYYIKSYELESFQPFVEADYKLNG